MKSKIIAGVGIVVLAIALIFAMKPKSFDKQFEKKMSDMNSYILEGNMEIAKGEDVKTYAVEVGYKKADKDFFKVTLTDKELNQEQIILRNDAGVFVVTPSLNQIFKFEEAGICRCSGCSRRCKPDDFAVQSTFCGTERAGNNDLFCMHTSQESNFQNPPDEVLPEPPCTAPSHLQKACGFPLQPQAGLLNHPQWRFLWNGRQSAQVLSQLWKSLLFSSIAPTLPM